MRSRVDHRTEQQGDQGVFYEEDTPAVAYDTTNVPVVIALTLAYNGAPFAGFARQPGQLTVQGSLEEALSLVFRRPIETVCAGRTDSGVHARGQVVSFELSAEEYRSRNDYKLLRSLNALTHDAISILSLEEKPTSFSARFSAVMREYRYFICVDQPAPLFMNQFSWHLGKALNLDAMRQGAQYLIGEHDFRSFCLAVSAQGKPTHRYVKSITVEPLEIWGEHFVVLTVEGNAFLHSMVRTIVGTLVAVGLNKREPSWVKEVLDARDRSAAGENAPAAGLVFWHVDYEGERVYDPRTRNNYAPPQANERIDQMPAAFPVQEGPTVSAHDVPQQPKEHSSKQVVHKGGHKSRTEFVIPRGEGASLISGAAFSPVNRPIETGDRSNGSGEEDIGRSVFTQTPPIYGGTEQFGEVIWDSTGDIDEPVAAVDSMEEVMSAEVAENDAALSEAHNEQSEHEKETQKEAPIATFGSYPFQIKPL